MVLDQRKTIGIMSATMGVLFKKAEAKQQDAINRNCALALDLGTPNSFPMYQSTAPVMVKPCATTNNTYRAKRLTTKVL